MHSDRRIVAARNSEGDSRRGDGSQYRARSL